MDSETSNQDSGSRNNSSASNQATSQTPVVLVVQPDEDKVIRHSFKNRPRLAVGRYPECEICIDLPHISGDHMVLVCDWSGAVIAVDTSTNGTFRDSVRLEKGVPSQIGRSYAEFDLQMDTRIAVCFDQEQQKSFLKSLGLTLRDVIDASVQGSTDESSATVEPEPSPYRLKTQAAVQGKSATETIVCSRQPTIILDASEMGLEPPKNTSSTLLLGIAIGAIIVGAGYFFFVK